MFGRISLAVLLVASGAAVDARQQDAAPCTSQPAFSWLDLWVGDWDVYVQGNKAGQNKIERILDGCAVSEDWTDSNGRRGRSLFYVDPATGTWKQVWVTDRALARGGVKEKALVERGPDGSLRFQGEIRLESGGSYLDRTTLTPAGPDEVRQVIEISTDRGQSWTTMFDGRYVRRR